MAIKLPYNKIPRYIGPGNYNVDVMWRSLDRTLAEYERMVGLDLDPDFQRGHVWTEAQQKAYLEFIIRGGQTGKDLKWNCPGWNSDSMDIRGPMVLVDGKQRLNAVLRFLRDELTVFDGWPDIGPILCSEMEVLRDIECRFKFYVNGLESRPEVLEWYLQLNDGGTVHSAEELDRVRLLLAEERKHVSAPDRER